jgi:hypothetical protein
MRISSLAQRQDSNADTFDAGRRAQPHPVVLRPLNFLASFRPAGVVRPNRLRSAKIGSDGSGGGINHIARPLLSDR